MWEGIKDSIQIMLEFFVILLIGVAARRKNYLSETARRGATELLLCISAPAAILSVTATVQMKPELFVNIGILVMITAIGYVFSIGGSTLFAKALRLRNEEKSGFIGPVAFKNIAFLGFPLCIGLLGRESLFYASICSLLFNLVLWTYGVWLYSGRKGVKLGEVAKNPSTIACIVMLAMVAAGLRFPKAAEDALQVMGDTCTPLSILAVGMMLSDIHVAEIFRKPVIYQVSVGSLLVFPCVIGLLVALFHPVAEVARVLILLSAVPPAALNAILAEEYGHNGTDVSITVVCTMLFSLVTFPMVTGVLNYLLKL